MFITRRVLADWEDSTAAKHLKELLCECSSQHTQAITDLSVGAGGMAAKLVTCSEDQTIRIWLACNGTAVGCIALSSPARCLAVGPLEGMAFVGLAEGPIAQVQLNKASSVLEALEKGADPGRHLVGHSRAVCSLDITTSGDLLVSGALSTAWMLQFAMPSATCRCQVRVHNVPFMTVLLNLPGALGIRGFQGMWLR
jgi:WD40 repeat protein